jgi:Cu2+-containing amine oxidase
MKGRAALFIVLLLAAPTLQASPYGRDVLSIRVAGYTWGVWKMVDVPTGNPNQPYVTEVYLDLGPFATVQLGNPSPLGKGLGMIFAIGLLAVMYAAYRRHQRVPEDSPG